MAEQSSSPKLKALFQPLAEQLAAQEATIGNELLAAQGAPVDLGGYYHPDPVRASAALRPSATWNRILAEFAGS